MLNVQKANIVFDAILIQFEGVLILRNFATILKKVK